MNGEVIRHTIVTTEANMISFRQTPTFGHGVIRRFSNNASEMRRLVARDFEDILQVSIYVFLR